MKAQNKAYGNTSKPGTAKKQLGRLVLCAQGGRMKKPKVDPEFLGLCIADTLAGYLIRYLGIAKTTQTQIVSTHEERFRRPDKVEPGMWINKKGGNDYHHFELVKISDINNPKK